MSTSLVRLKRSNIDIDKSQRRWRIFTSTWGGGPHSGIPQKLRFISHTQGVWGICPFHAASALAQRFEKLPWEQFFKRFKIYPLIYPPSWAYCCILAYISLSPTATAHSQWLGSLECLTRRPVQNTILTANDIVHEFRGLAPVSQPYLLDITWEIPGKGL